MVDKQNRRLRVVLNYASEDQIAARLLYEWLTAIGADPWINREDLYPGQDWKDQIDKALRETDVVIVCLSKDSIIKSGYVQKEIRLALDVADEKPLGKNFIIPVRLGECNVPQPLRKHQWLDFFFDGKNFPASAYSKLFSSLQSCVIDHGTFALQRKDIAKRKANSKQSTLLKKSRHTNEETSQQHGESVGKSVGLPVVMPVIHKSSEVRYKSKSVPLTKLKNSGDESKSYIENNGNLLLKNSIARASDEQRFLDMIEGRLTPTRGINIFGAPGIGKSFLLKRYKELAFTKNYPVVYIDLHYSSNRQRSVFLREITQISGFHDSTIENIIQTLVHSGYEVPTGTSPQDDANYYLVEAVKRVAAKLSSRKKKGKNPVILIDTFDNNPSINELAPWLFTGLIQELIDVCYFVVAGRKSLEGEPYIPSELAKRFEWISLARFRNKDVQQLINLSDITGRTVDRKTTNNIIRLSKGNPLVVQWVLFYLYKFAREEDVNDLIQVTNIESALEKIARYLVNNPGTSGNYAILKALRTAAHFGAHFNFELFKAAVPENQLGGRSHKEIFEELSAYFYVRGESDSWTLHDQIREWMRRAFQERMSVNEFIVSSQRAIEKYYDPKIQKLSSNTHRTLEEQLELDELEAQRFYHLIYIEAQPGYKPANYHKKLWTFLEDLKKQFRLDQMAQVIQFGLEAQSWKFKAREDYLLTQILNTAQAWLHFYHVDYLQVEKYARAVLSDTPTPRLLKATALVILALLPATNPKHVLENYLRPALSIYQEILNEINLNKLPPDGFLNSAEEIYPKIHQVLMTMGRLHTIHCIALEAGERIIQEAYEISVKDAWFQPRYAATALNSMAQIERCAGQLDIAKSNVLRAITIYEAQSENPKSEFYLGYFFETLGLIYKEADEFEYALKAFRDAKDIYTNIPGSMDSYKYVVEMEIGEIQLFLRNYKEARITLNRAYEYFKARKSFHPYSYLSVLNKQGRYYTAMRKFAMARKFFQEQKSYARQTGHDLWYYWANQYLAELDYVENIPVDKMGLKALLHEFEPKGDFGPAIWETRLLLSNLADNEDERFTHLAEGLAYLAPKWRDLFGKKFSVLVKTLLELTPFEHRVRQIQRLNEFWENKFDGDDPAPKFRQTCKILMGQ
jgi:hypothetical protein